ncbi:SHNi-TPR domain-containing protein [Aspergillus glaucus CBS 516.65]|uniref:Tetratricopeptide SHNi-TPR domain-containing protein n=1 Tax=Aspergillus glaucus CBS 516.65 TaxID=1160497 RepID=A0A1L9VVX2_ASPGL|nr:hypothetical protein ASPGLDRAFT_32497 [Aspergillus glaucus CBS 516.65]OJJ88037.1 hypothetical protein ASPGLDRAFT_32497 [Aspergillus glaucus CBS 516.65]
MTDTERPGLYMAPMTNNAEEQRTRLGELVTRAAAKDAIKDHNAAAELYSEATELQADLNGEMSLDNADLLFAYGKALYNVAVSKSDVLGAKVAGEPHAQSNAVTTESSTSVGSTSASDNLIQSAVANGAAKKEAGANEKEQSEKQNTPFFQFTGDENFDESEEEEEDEGAQADAGDEDEDDFANAFEVLDLARVLYQKKLSAAEESDEKGKSTEVPSENKQLKERLADTYDLQAEISLEGERFLDAVTDLRTALDLRLALFPMEDPAVAECHYKLSLALEFGAVSKTEEFDEQDSHSQSKVDEEMRKEAVVQMEKAIESCQAQMIQEQKRLDGDDAPDEDKATALKRRIDNVKEIVADMEQRLIDLRRPPVLIEEQERSDEAVLKGILGQIVGQSTAEQTARLDAATKSATDLSAFVKRKPASGQSSQKPDSSNKRPVEQSSQGNDVKRARVSDGNVDKS